MLNRVILIGRLVRDPEFGYIHTGAARARMRIAVDRPRRNPETNERETDFIDIVLWEKNAEFAREYLKKGRLVAVEGRLQIRSWDAQDGTRRWAAEVVADRVVGLDRPREGAVDEPPQPPDVEAVLPEPPAAAGVGGDTDPLPEGEENDPFAEI